MGAKYDEVKADIQKLALKMKEMGLQYHFVVAEADETTIEHTANCFILPPTNENFSPLLLALHALAEKEQLAMVILHMTAIERLAKMQAAAVEAAVQPEAQFTPPTTVQ